jgi:hypothetical protein
MDAFREHQKGPSRGLERFELCMVQHLWRALAPGWKDGSYPLVSDFASCPSITQRFLQSIHPTYGIQQDWVRVQFVSHQKRFPRWPMASDSTSRLNPFRAEHRASRVALRTKKNRTTYLYNGWVIFRQKKHKQSSNYTWHVEILHDLSPGRALSPVE